MSQDFNETVSLLVEEVMPLLANKPPHIVGAALADIVAIWVACHIVPGDPKETDEYREMLVKHHIATLRQLIPVNAHIVETAGGNVIEVSVAKH